MSASLGVSVRRDGFYKGVVLIDLPILKDLVLIGGGHSHVTVLKQFGMQPLPGAHLTLVSRSVDTPYSGMLPGLIAGHYSYDDSHIDLRMLARFADAKVIVDEAVGLDQRPSPLQQGLGGRPLEASMGTQQPFPDEAKGLAEEACVEAPRFPATTFTRTGTSLHAWGLPMTSQGKAPRC